MDDYEFLRQVEALAQLDAEQAFGVTIAVLQELHDRLTAREADQLAAQLPTELKQRWHDFDAPGQDVRRTHAGDFLRHIAETTKLDQDQARRGLMAVFKTMQMLLGSLSGFEGEAGDVLSQLPMDLKRLWQAAAALTPAPKA